MGAASCRDSPWEQHLVGAASCRDIPWEQHLVGAASCRDRPAAGMFIGGLLASLVICLANEHAVHSAAPVRVFLWEGLPGPIIYVSRLEAAPTTAAPTVHQRHCGRAFQAR